MLSRLQLSVYCLHTSLALLALSGCSDDDNPVDTSSADASLIMIGEAVSEGTRVQVYSEGRLHVGYNRLFVALRDSASDEQRHEAYVEIQLSMQMQMENDTMMHGAPVENPSSAESEDGMFAAGVVFIMPGTWQLGVEFRATGSDRAGTALIEAEVEGSNLVKAVTGNDGKEYFVTLVAPRAPVAGLNDFEITVHRMESMASFPGVEDLTVGMEPSMPSMGHGSPSNVNPTHTGSGHYVGRVNFTMTGDWRIDVSLSKDGSVLLDTRFDMTLE